MLINDSGGSVRATRPVLPPPPPPPPPAPVPASASPSAPAPAKVYGPYVPQAPAVPPPAMPPLALLAPPAPNVQAPYADHKAQQQAPKDEGAQLPGEGSAPRIAKGANEGKGVGETPAQAPGSPLDNLLKVSPFPSLAPDQTPAAVTAGPVPWLDTFAMTPQDKGRFTQQVISGIAAGQSLEQAAAAHGTNPMQVCAIAQDAGIRIEAHEVAGGDVQITTLQQGDHRITYSHDLQHDTVIVDGSYTGSNGKRQEVHATLDGNGVVTRTEHDAKRGITTTRSTDGEAGTRTETVVHPDGRRTQTTFAVAEQDPVKRKLKAGDSLEGIAKKLGIDVEDLAAMNPQLIKNPKKFKVGAEIVVGVPPRVVKEYGADGSMLQTSTKADGSRQIVFVAESGRSKTIKGPPTGQELTESTLRNGLFKEGKSVEQVAQDMGMTPQQVLDALDPGTVEVEKEPAGPTHNGIETRRIHDPQSNRLLIETTDLFSGKTRREVIDDKQTYDVRVMGPDGQYVPKKMKGGEGYKQWQATQAQDQVGGWQRQIDEVNQQIRMTQKTGEPVSGLLEQRRELEARRAAAQQDAAVAQVKASAVTQARGQHALAGMLAEVDGTLQFTAPGSKLHSQALAQRDGLLAAMEDQDRLIDTTLAGVDLADAAGGLGRAKEVTRQAEDALEAKYQQWKQDVWAWGGLSEESIQRFKAQGQHAAPGNAPEDFKNEQERDKQAREEFDLLVQGDGYLPPGIRTECRDAWQARNAAVAGEQKADAGFKGALMASDAAAERGLQAGIDRLAGQERSWGVEHPGAFIGSFPGRQALNELKARQGDLKIRQLETGDALKHDQFLLTLSDRQRADPDSLKEAEQDYEKKHQPELARLSIQIDDIKYGGIRAQAKEAENFISDWAQKNPQVQAQLEALEQGPIGNVRQADRRGEQVQEMLASAPGGPGLLAARGQLGGAHAVLRLRNDSALEQMNQDDERIQKSIDNHSFVRDGWAAMFGDASHDAKRYTAGQEDAARALDQKLVTGGLSVSEFAKQSDELIDGYALQSLDYGQKLQDSDEVWGMVDEAVRSTVIAAAGIATTMATGNIAAGIGVSMAVAQAWDGANDINAVSEGRDMHADGHSSLVGLLAKSDKEGVSWNDAKATLKDDLIDLASSATNLGGLAAGAKVSASLVARAGGSSALGLGQRAMIGGAAGFTSQGVTGAGNVGVETLHVALDGQWGTAQGNERIRAAGVNAGLGLATAPLTGAASGALPLKLGVPGTATAMQFVNDAAGGLGTAQLSALVMDGRGMNKAEFISTAVQSVSGTMLNRAMHPLMEPAGMSGGSRYLLSAAGTVVSAATVYVVASKTGLPIGDPAITNPLAFSVRAVLIGAKSRLTGQIGQQVASLGPDPTANKPVLEWLEKRLVTHGARIGVSKADRMEIQQAIEAVRKDPSAAPASFKLLEGAKNKVLSPRTLAGMADALTRHTTFAYNLGNAGAWLAEEGFFQPGDAAYWTTTGFAGANLLLTNSNLNGAMAGLKGADAAPSIKLAQLTPFLGMSGFALSAGAWAWSDFDPSVAGVTKSLLDVTFGAAAGWQAYNELRGLQGKHPTGNGKLPAPLEILAASLVARETFDINNYF